MASRPNASLKDLLSTGYFFEKLKDQPKTTEMELSAYIKHFVVPYLIATAESHETSGQRYRSIVNLAVKHLSEVKDHELEDSIFGLKKVAISEMDVHEKALVQIEPLGKSESRARRQKLESAKALTKLLISVIKLFKLAEVVTKRDGSNETRATIADAISGDWARSLIQSA